MRKTQVYFPEDDLRALHAVARKTKKSVASLIREAVQSVWLAPNGASPPGPVALWDGPLARVSDDHDAIYDEP